MWVLFLANVLTLSTYGFSAQEHTFSVFESITQEPQIETLKDLTWLYTANSYSDWISLLRQADSEIIEIIYQKLLEIYLQKSANRVIADDFLLQNTTQIEEDGQKIEESKQKITYDDEMIDYLEKYIPILAEVTTKAAYLQALASGSSVLIVRNGYIVEMYPDGVERIIKKLLPPTPVISD